MWIAVSLVWTFGCECGGGTAPMADAGAPQGDGTGNDARDTLDAATGDAMRTNCFDLKRAMSDWIVSHRSCTDSCERVDPPLVPENTDGLCNQAVSYGVEDEAALEALVARWKAAECEDFLDGVSPIFTCPYIPGTATCIEGQCVLEFREDPNCPEDLMPVCTESGSKCIKRLLRQRIFDESASG